MYLIENHVLGVSPVLGSRVRLTAGGLTESFVYVGMTMFENEQRPVVVPLDDLLRNEPKLFVCERSVRFESVEEPFRSDVRGIQRAAAKHSLQCSATWPSLESYCGQVSILSPRISDPMAGDIVRLEGADPYLFCGSFKGKWLLASKSQQFFGVGAYQALGENWTTAVTQPQLVELCGVRSDGAAEIVFRQATRRGHPGAEIQIHETKGIYLRWDGRHGLYDLVAVPVTEETRPYLRDVDIDRFVRVDEQVYGVLYTTTESIRVRDFPDESAVDLALRIATQAPLRGAP